MTQIDGLRKLDSALKYLASPERSLSGRDFAACKLIWDTAKLITTECTCHARFSENHLPDCPLAQ